MQLLKGVTIASGGVLPNIHPELLKKRKGGKLVAPEEISKKKPKETSSPKKAAANKQPAKPKKTAEKQVSKGKGKVRVLDFFLYLE